MSEEETCPICDDKETRLIYQAAQVPFFQNKVYSTKALAQNVGTGSITLHLCDGCGFVFNSSFKNSDMVYDKNYQNEQAHSSFFQAYLSFITYLFTQHFQGKKIVEVGCGKGYFLELLLANGFDVYGFDPAYEGENTRITKDYFSSKYNHIDAQVIVLRHVLEHIEHPFEFLHEIAAAVNYDAQIYIEVPDFEWIISHDAFWDIFYEHCNYFNKSSLGNFFQEKEQGFLFNGQYLYLIADLKKLHKRKEDIKSFPMVQPSLERLNKNIQDYRKILLEQGETIIWGAGAKGVTFANLIDPNAELIPYLVDINPQKQNCFIPKTGHSIISPAALQENDKPIIVMNDNYLEEIKKMVPELKDNFITLSNFLHSKDAYA